ncbi:ankyrin repeat domain-containing protein [Estrella lausannensis]|nr:ankyrin repeat domain-containing protein [Estrella lausannensis]
MKDMSDANVQVAMQIESFKYGNPPFATAVPAGAARGLGLQEEILNFIESAIRFESSGKANQSDMGINDKALAFLYLMHQLASLNRLNDVLADGEFQGTSIPWLLAFNRKWDLLEKMIVNNIDIDFNSSPVIGQQHENSIFLLSIFAQQSNLARFILNTKKPIDINAVISEGPFAGANALYLMAITHQWDLVRETLAAYPHVDINSSSYQPLPDTPLGAKVIHLAALCSQWDIVHWLLCNRLDCQVNKPIDTIHEKGITLPLLAASHGQWDVLETILKRHPVLNINAAITTGDHAGYTILSILGLHKRWDLFSTVLNLYPHASVNASPHHGDQRGMTPLLMAAEAQQWHIVAKAIELQPDADLDTTYERCPLGGATPFWHAVNNRQWPIALTMLSINPYLNIECGPDSFSPLTSALVNKQTGFAKLFLLLGAKDPPQDDLINGTLNGVQTPLPIQYVAQTWRSALELTRVKIYDTLYNTWNRPENHSFAWIRSDRKLRSQIACEILIAEHPEIPFFHGLEKIVEKWVNLDDQRNVEAKERVAILALRQYRYNNGTLESPAPKVIRDIRRLILESIAEVGKNYPFECTNEVRREIVERIGVEQKGNPRLTKSFVEKAIKSAVIPDNPGPPTR